MITVYEFFGIFVAVVSLFGGGCYLHAISNTSKDQAIDHLEAKMERYGVEK